MVGFKQSIVNWYRKFFKYNETLPDKVIIFRLIVYLIIFLILVILIGRDIYIFANE